MDGMIELNDAKMKAILRFIISLMRDDTVMYNCYILDSANDPWIKTAIIKEV